MAKTTTGGFKEALDQNRLTDDLKNKSDKSDSVASSVGIGGDNIAELNPTFNRLSYESVYHGKHDAWIVLGRDRIGEFEGYGNLGHTSCASMDLVVGRKSAFEEFNVKTDTTGPDFKNDAARVYISQKTDIDKAFGIPAGKSGISEGRSGVALKADAIRIVGRESLKLIVNTDQKNSRGGNVNTFSGIELIGGDISAAKRVMLLKHFQDDQKREIMAGGMQPIPLGINTVYAFDQLAEKVDKVAGVISTLGMILKDYMIQMAPHTHENVINTFFGVPVLPSDDSIAACMSAMTSIVDKTIVDIGKIRNEITTYKKIHLTQAGVYYINSKYHSLN